MLSNNRQEKIIDKLQPLKKIRLNYISRASNMLDIGFGENVEYISLNGEKRIVARFSLHVHSSWRLVNQDIIVLAQRDFYVPKEGIPYELFDANMFGNSYFDSKANVINDCLSVKPIFTKDIEANPLGDITIHFEEGFRLEIIVDITGMKESWRFFEMNSEDEHFIVFPEY